MEPPRENRQYKRIKAIIDVVCEYEGQIRAATNRATDLGGGGMFIDIWSPPPLGTLVDIRFQLPDGGNSIRAKSEVRYSQLGVGIGIKFVQIDSNDLARLIKYVETHS